jgi:signal peptidase II
LERDRRPLFFLVLIGAVVLDQAVKAWVRHTLYESQSPGFPLPGIFEITLSHNKGVAWGMLQGKGVFMTPIALIIAAIAIRHAWKNPTDTRWTMILAALMGAGALGNLIDRLWLGYVTDMFWFRLINFPVFNVADSCITIATFMLVVTWLREPKGPKSPANANPPATEANQTS